MRVMMGARTQEQCLRRDVGRASRLDCLLGQSRMSLIISSTAAGGKTLKSGGVTGEEGNEENEQDWLREKVEAGRFCL